VGIESAATDPARRLSVIRPLTNVTGEHKYELQLKKFDCRSIQETSMNAEVDDLSDEEEEAQTDAANLAWGVGLGIGIGAAVGLATHSLPMWIALGTGIGVAVPALGIFKR